MSQRDSEQTEPFIVFFSTSDFFDFTFSESDTVCGSSEHASRFEAFVISATAY